MSVSISPDERAAIRQATAEFCRAATTGDQIVTAMTGPGGYDPLVWRRLTTELGLTGLLVPEAAGGLGLGFTEAAVVLAEAGRCLLPSPLLPTLAMTQVLAHLNTDVGLDLAARIVSSGASVTLAIQETPFAAAPVGEGVTATHATATHPTVAHIEGGLLHGRKHFVLHGDTAEVILVAAADGLYAVNATDPGVTRAAHMTLDQTRRLATLTFAGAHAIRLGDLSAVSYADDILLVALAVEAAAAAQECLDRTVAYLKVREQFGRALATFQALRHRCAALAVRVQGARALADAAVTAVDDSSANLPLLAPMARRHCGDVFMAAAGEMIQLHGGIGFTWEHPAHLYLKRATSTQLLLGTSEELRDRVGRHIGL